MDRLLYNGLFVERRGLSPTLTINDNRVGQNVDPHRCTLLRSVTLYSPSNDPKESFKEVIFSFPVGRERRGKTDETYVDTVLHYEPYRRQ